MINTEDKILIVKSEINALERQAYQLELQCRVFKQTEQEDQLQFRTQSLVKTQEQIDFYNKELKALEKNVNKA